jgi:hypothetical protein
MRRERLRHDMSGLFKVTWVQLMSCKILASASTLENVSLSLHACSPHICYTDSKHFCRPFMTSQIAGASII